MSEELDPQEQAILDTLVEKALGPTPMPLELDVDSPALRNYAVARCAAARDKAYRQNFAKTKNEYKARDAAVAAYRNALPPLCGYDNICDFIACASYGMLTKAIDADTGTKLLYAAQIAMATISQKAKTQTRPA